MSRSSALAIIAFGSATYLTIHEADGDDLTYKITETRPL